MSDDRSFKTESVSHEKKKEEEEKKKRDQIGLSWENSTNIGGEGGRREGGGEIGWERKALMPMSLLPND